MSINALLREKSPPIKQLKDVLNALYIFAIEQECQCVASLKKTCKRCRTLQSADNLAKIKQDK